jgi:hypothetical protein
VKKVDKDSWKIISLRTSTVFYMIIAIRIEVLFSGKHAWKKSFIEKDKFKVEVKTVSYWEI